MLTHQQIPLLFLKSAYIKQLLLFLLHIAIPGFPQSDHTVSKLSADPDSLWNTVKQASRPQVILKTQPPICLDYKARNRPYTYGNLSIYQFSIPKHDWNLSVLCGFVRSISAKQIASKPQNCLIGPHNVGAVSCRGTVQYKFIIQRCTSLSVLLPKRRSPQNSILALQANLSFRVPTLSEF